MASTPLASSGLAPLTITLPSAASIPLKINQVANKNGPDQKFQITERILYEREFPGQAYVSAHLQRLQNGVHDSDNLHTENTLHVTFVAIHFVLHPSLSVAHRFESAMINITARSANNEQLRFLKYAPHAAYGRMSTESLKWNFQLGASVGVTKSPVSVGVTSSVSESKEKVVGTMMKIQGSTRSSYHREPHSVISEHRKPDTKLVWSLEENSQQESGLPREFTFVFLVERPAKPRSMKHKDCEKPADNKNFHLHHVQGDGTNSPTQNKGLSPSLIMTPPASKSMSGLDYITISPEELPLDPNNHPHKHGLEEVFSPIHFSITVTPRISGTMTAQTFDMEESAEESVVEGEVGQKFPTGGIHGEHADHCVDGMYNFAKLPGNFEDLMELPGNSITSVEPTVGEK
ncbi:hypothetical protein PVAG01_09583 [Phlyctema vagabunda]|uniref:Uncharacterized protein n=1 Tax=Phlyctema vagabunda TaxID=108571 RepID=A0ABR4P8F2_9HELO